MASWILNSTRTPAPNEYIIENIPRGKQAPRWSIR